MVCVVHIAMYSGVSTNTSVPPAPSSPSNMTLPFGVTPDRAHFYTMNGSARTVTFIQAVDGKAASFDGGKTTLDVGYHGRGSFTACVLSGESLCGCSWPLTEAAAMECVPLNSDQIVRTKTPAYNAVLAHGVLMSVAWGIVFPLGATAPRFWKRHSWWFQAHRGLQLLGGVLTLVGFVMIVIATPSGSHFSHEPHRLVGLVLCVALLAQLVSGVVRPHKAAHKEEQDEEDEEKKKQKTKREGGWSRRAIWKVGHAVLGLLLLVLGVYQLVSGSQWSGYEWLAGVWGSGFLAVFLLTLGSAVHSCCRPGGGTGTGTGTSKVAEGGDTSTPPAHNEEDPGESVSTASAEAGMELTVVNNTHHGCGGGEDV